MLKDHYTKGQRDALTRFKLANPAKTPLGGPLPGGALPNAPTAAPASAAAPMAADVAKSKVLG